MKRYLLCWAFLALHATLWAQNTPNAFADRINYIFHHLDKSQVPTGVLLDYGIDFAKTDLYTGAVLHDSNFVGPGEFMDLYNTIYSSQIVNQNFVSPADVANAFNTQAAAGSALPFGIMAFSVNRFRDDALSTGLLSVTNDQILDNPFRIQSPYQQETIFAAAPMRSMIENGNSTFEFSTSLRYSNFLSGISKLEVDLGSGYSQIAFNQPYPFGFTTAGIYNVAVRVTYKFIGSFVSHTKIVVKHDLPTTAPRFQPTGANVLINNARAFQGISGTATLQIRLSPNNTTGAVRRPLIVVEGFDPWRILTPDQPATDYEVQEFIRFGLDRVLQQSGFQYDFHEQLSTVDNYDLVFVNFTDGTDFIQRNAFVLAEAIQWVNANKTTFNGVREPNVIMGLSMGGLVTRYALRDMENLGLAHECRLFISHDSPHEGANIPLGIQMTAFHLGNISVSAGLPGLYVIPIIPTANFNPFGQIRDFGALANTAAARQMLIQRALYIPTGPRSGMFSVDRATHNQWQTEYDQMGWPINCRMVAVSNGSCTSDLLFPDNSRLFTVNGHLGFTYFGQMWRSYIATLAGLYTNSGTFLEFPLSLVSTKTSLEVDIWANAVAPNGQPTQIYNGDMFIKRKILWAINVHTYITRSEGYSGTNALPLDNSPAGVYDLAQFGIDNATIQAALPDFLNFVTANFTQPRFSFIPKGSSLSITNPLQNLRANTCNASYVCEGRTEFQNYYSPNGTNEQHIAFNRANAEFIMAELRGIPPPLNLPPLPTFTRSYGSDCSSVTITASGANAQCYDWQTTGNLILSNNQTSLTCGPATMTIQGGSGTIRVRVLSGTCYSQWVDICFNACQDWPNPNFQWIYSAPSTGEPLQAQVDPYPYQTQNPVTYDWYINGQFIMNTGGGTYFYSTNWPCTSEGAGLTVVANVDCGRSIAINGGVYWPICYGGRKAAPVKVYPNPAQSFVTIAIEDMKEGLHSRYRPTTSILQILQITLYDKMGQVRRKVKGNLGLQTLQIPVSDLPNDVYYAEIYDGKQTYKVAVIVEK